MEKMCFCSYFLCNKAGWSSTNPNFLLIIGATMFCVLLNSCHYTTCKSSYGIITTTRLNNNPPSTASLESCDKATQPPHTHGGQSISQHTVSQIFFYPNAINNQECTCTTAYCVDPELGLAAGASNLGLK